MKIHFIGIGGIGVSALSQYFLIKGNKVTGSDLFSSEIINTLKKKGVRIKIGRHKKENIKKDTDLVIYSPAVPSDNPEVLQAKAYKIKTLSYPRALGLLTKQYFTIAVSGTHGKSTVTAMIALILIKAGFDPTVILGTKLKEFNNSNCRVGNSKYLVIEADEWGASFLNYWPKIIVLTNIEREHLDFYKNLSRILKTYRNYIMHLDENGVLIANKNDENITKLLKDKKLSRNIFYFSLKNEAKIRIRKVLKIPGNHNVSNALAALKLARILKVPDKISFKALSQYKGAWRRFEEKNIKIKNKNYKIISDYGHHPTEIKVTLKAAREKYPQRKIWCIFQPHQYQRTYYLFNDFVKVFRESGVDKVIITDIFDVFGREEKKITKRVSSENLAKKINKNKVIYLPKNKIIDHLKENLRGKEVIIIMGAGDIYELIV